MRIIVGIDKVSDIPQLAKNGADDFFCGLLSGKDNLLNHRPNTTKYNLKNIKELKQAIKLAHQNKGKLFLVLNNTTPKDHECDNLIKKIKKFDQIQVDALIVNDIALINICRLLKLKIKLSLSSVVMCSNSQCVEFYKSLGVNRIVIPQQITPAEYTDMFKKNKDIETEVFFHLYNNCNNIDGICRYHDRQLFNVCNNKLPLMPCIFKPNINTFFKKSSSVKKIESLLIHPPIFDHLGYLYDFYKLGVSTVKLGIRGFPIEEKIKRVRYLKNLLSLIDKSKNKDDFLKKAKKIANSYTNIDWNEKNFLSQQYIIK